MGNDELEKRIAKLEQEIVDLKKQLRSLPIKDWRSTVGMFANDPVFDEIVRLGREYREEQRKDID
jgi:hypothetical protein